MLGSWWRERRTRLGGHGLNGRECWRRRQRCGQGEGKEREEEERGRGRKRRAGKEAGSEN